MPDKKPTEAQIKAQIAKLERQQKEAAMAKLVAQYPHLKKGAKR